MGTPIDKAVHEWTVKEIAAQEHDHDWTQCWSKNQVLKQKFAKTQDSNCMSDACRVISTNYEELSYVFTVNDMVMSDKCVGHGGPSHSEEQQRLHGQRHIALTDQYSKPNYGTDSLLSLPANACSLESAQATQTLKWTWAQVMSAWSFLPSPHLQHPSHSSPNRDLVPQKT